MILISGTHNGHDHFSDDHVVLLYRVFLLALTSVSVDFAVIVLDELLYEGTVLVQDLISHVGDVMEHGLILHLMETMKMQKLDTETDQCCHNFGNPTAMASKMKQKYTLQVRP